ncbi:hypothetical protein SAMN05443428_101229 [Caloramator quimbayensis]|uniref:Glycosyltransferase, GT2 family n=1 Tax=Caloramator quimbayensis TaxID=1147123 RepID=A0A1T4WH39_9CLOT|nr:glycosyltransferase [Caloramator quimbayensis]SKA76610.1 hypothetical protein SAMN05443428_101229 [Caloramator quimbayensis]
MGKKVSIVICTYNRGSFIVKTLESLSNLKYKNFEVIVVNGPSTDETREILQLYKHCIKIRNNNIRNLSVSRNIGIRASSGDIIAFIDDDAIPDPYWLNDIISYYEDDTVGGVGGKVYGPGATHFQFTNGTINLWGETEPLRSVSREFNDPNGEIFNIMMGTNATFSRKALEKVGGFDEYYEYYHDESDVAVRLIRAGYKILHHPNAYIHHEFAKSHIRTTQYKLNWYPIVKNTVYFGLKNSEGYFNLDVRKKQVKKTAEKWKNNFRKWYNSKVITKEEYSSFMDMWEKGFSQGMIDGLNTERQLAKDLSPDSDFVKYDPIKISIKKDRLNICLLCKDNPMVSYGGVATYSKQLALGYKDKGHTVHIITSGQKYETKLYNDIYIHTVKEDDIKIKFLELQDYNITAKNINYSYLLYKTIYELNKKYDFDIIESPLWDFEGIIPAKLINIPVVTRLQTPLLKVIETQKWNMNDDFALASKFEKKLIEMSSGIIAISENIKKTISELYNIDFDDKFVRKIYLGIDRDIEKNKNKVNNNFITVLFVGRLERRKGIHLILEIIPEILEKHKNVRFKFIGDDSIVAENGKTYKEIFYATNKNKNIINNVEFLGKVNSEILKNEYRNCDIFISPSLYESFGIIFLEAMRVGKPVIGGNVGGMKEIIVNGENGYLVDVNSSNDLLDKLNILINDENKRKEMGQKGYQRFNELFTINNMLDDSIEFYKDVIYRFSQQYCNVSKIKESIEDILMRKQPYKLKSEDLKIIGWSHTKLQQWGDTDVLMSSNKGDSIEFSSEKTIKIRFLKHGWSGIVNIYKDNEKLEILDLYNKDIDYDYYYEIKNDENIKHYFKIEVSGDKNICSNDVEVWVGDIYEY